MDCPENRKHFQPMTPSHRILSHVGGRQHMFRPWFSSSRFVALAMFVSITAVASTAGTDVPHLPTAVSVGPQKLSGLDLRWFGTSTATVSDGETTIMIDGFFSRPGMIRLGLAWTGLPLVRPDEHEISKALTLLNGQPIDAIFVSHAHHDHVLDSATIAHHKTSKVYGSVSAGNVVHGQRPEIQFIEVADGDILPVGAFEVRILESSHQPTTFGPSGDILRPLAMPARLRAFRSGPSFSFFITHPKGSVLIVPSAVVDDQPPTLDGVSADVVLLGIGLLGKESKETMKRYWTSVVCASNTTRVHPIHWDNFMRPLGEPMTPIPTDDLRNSVETLSSYAKADGIEFSYLPLATRVVMPLKSPRRSRCDVCPCSSEQL